MCWGDFEATLPSRVWEGDWELLSAQAAASERASFTRLAQSSRCAQGRQGPGMWERAGRHQERKKAGGVQGRSKRKL